MLSIERFVDDIAVCSDENGDKLNIPREKLPKSAVEGDILTQEPNGGYSIDSDATAAAKSRLFERLNKLGTRSRRDRILSCLQDADKPVSASALAEKYHVSRQIVVGDIALLRAGGAPIIATPRGYILENGAARNDTFTIACRHDNEGQLLEELYVIVDNGATAVDVIVDHPVYGQIVGQLHISSRFDADKFAETLKSSNAAPLSLITDGIHLHTIRCSDEEKIKRIKSLLTEKDILISE